MSGVLWGLLGCWVVLLMGVVRLMILYVDKLVHDEFERKFKD